MLRNMILLFLYVSQSDENKVNLRIGKGYHCPIAKHSYMVALVHLKENESVHFIGGGTLLSSRWVLSAVAHIYNYEVIDYYTVIAGISKISEITSKSNLMQMSSVEFFYRPNYLVTDALDIALLKLKKPMYESKTVSFVQLATEDDMKDEELEDICANATIIGYGDKSDDYPIFDGLNCAQAPVISNKKCNEELPYFILQEQLACIFEPNVHVCYGDVGGPMMCNGIQYGVLSSGYGGSLKIPSIITRVDKYNNFIKKKIAGNKIARESKATSNNSFNFYVLILSFFCFGFLLH